MLALETMMIVPAIRPVDLQDGANNGDFVSLKNYAHCAVVFHSAVGTGGDDPTINLNQATDVSGTSSKSLSVIDTIYVKQAATSLASTGQSSKVTQSAAATYTAATRAEQEALWVVEFDADELDVDNGFDCVQLTVADIGSNAQLGAAYYILTQPRFPAAPENMLSAIGD